MARKNLNAEPKTTPSESLEELSKVISSYAVNKDLEKKYKDEASAENTRIKTLMETLGISECHDADDKFIATVSEQKKETFNEEQLIQFLKDNGYAKDIVKKKEYVDYDALESAIYHSMIPDSVLAEMNDCKEIKVTKVLRIKELKGE